MAISQKFLIRKSPGLRLIVSFADPSAGHHGGIYQANGWLYAGATKPGRVGFIIKGKKTHTRSIGSMKGGVQSLDWVQRNLDTNAKVWDGLPKHRYLMPLDDEIRKQIQPLSKPYPKRIKELASVPAERGQCDSDLSAPI